MPEPIGQKISEKIIARLEPQIEKANQVISEGIINGIKDYFTNKDFWGKKIADTIRKSWRFVTGEMVLEPEIIKNYPLGVNFAIKLNQNRLVAQNKADLAMKEILGHIGPKGDLTAEDRARETLSVLSDLNKLRDKFFDYRAVSKEDLTQPINEIKKKITFLDGDQLTALKNILKDNAAKLAALEEKEGRRITMETVYKVAKKELKLAKDKGYIAQVENIFKNLLGMEDVKIEHIYFPEFSPEFMKKRYELDKLTPILPDKLVEKVGFYEKQRYLSMWQDFDDPLEAYKFFQTQYEFDKNYNKILKDALFDYDILRRLSADEIKRLNDFIGDFGSDRILKREDLKKAGLDFLLDKFPETEEGVIMHSFAVGKQTRDFNRKEKAILDLMAEGLTDRQLNELGIQRKVVLLPLSYERWLNNLLKTYGGVRGWGRQIESLVPGLRYLVTFWKKLVTMYLGGIPFQVMNGIGDMYRMISFAPEAITKLGESASLLMAYLGGNMEKLGEKYTAEQLKRRIAILENTAHSFVDFITDAKTPYFRSLKKISPTSPFDIWHWIDDHLQLFYQYRESLPKLAVALYNLERVEKGLAPVFRGAPQYLKEMYKAGYVYDAIGTYGRYVTVDYAAINPAFRRVFSNAIAPFSFWYVRNFKSLLEYTIQTKGIAPALAYVAPIAALYLLNNPENDPKAREYEERLPDWVKYSMHLNVKVSKSTKKLFNLKQDYITIGFQTPWDIAAQFIGIDQIWKLYDQWKDKKITDEYFKESIVWTVLGEAPTKTALSLLNPLLKAFIDIQANRDSFTGRKIVPDRLLGTPQEKSLHTAHILNSLSLTPIIPMMGITNQADIDYILQEVDKRGLDTRWKTAVMVLWETMKKPFDLKKTLAIRDYDYSNFAKRDVFENWEIQRKNYEDYMERVMQALLRGDKREFMQRMEAIKLGEVPGVEPELAYEYLTRPSNLERLIRRVAELKLPPEKKEQVERILNMLDVYQSFKQMNKGFRNQTAESLSEYFESLKEQ